MASRGFGIGDGSDCLSAYCRYLDIVGSGPVGGGGAVATLAEWLGVEVRAEFGGPILLGEEFWSEGILRRRLAAPVGCDGGESASHSGVAGDESGGSGCVRDAFGSGGPVVTGDVGVGDSGVESSSVGAARGKHWKKNRQNRLRREEKKKKKAAAVAADTWRKGVPEAGAGGGITQVLGGEKSCASCSSGGDDSGVGLVPVKDELRASLEAKWRAKNALEEAKAKRQLELLQAQDVGQLKKLQERKVHSATERAMVAAERAHATLRATGNVPGVVPDGGYDVGVAPVEGAGFCETLVECTISPDSSASMKEFRECQKKLADVEAEFAAFKLQVKKDKFNRHEAVTMTCDSEGDLSEAREEWIQECVERDRTCEDEREYLYAEERNENGELALRRTGVRVRKVLFPPSDDGEFYV